MKNMGRIFMNPREMGPKVREEERNHEANRTAAWEAEQQRLREQQEQQEADASQSNLAQVFGHQEDEPEIDPDQMTLDQFGQPQLPNLFDYEGGNNA
jgi:hypothetical protein